MIRRLIEQDYFRHSPNAAPTTEAVDLWLRELRSAGLLLEVAMAYGESAKRLASERPALAAALNGDAGQVSELLEAEGREERRRDREHSAPLKLELEQLRLRRDRGTS